LILWHTDLVG